MILNPIYNYKKLDRRDNGPNGRVYIDAAGNKIPSVTNILSTTKDTSHLDAWKKRIGKDKAQQIVTESADLGTMVHSHLEAYILGKERPGGNNYGRLMAAKMADTIINQGLVDVDEIWGVETHLFFETLWAGTTDAVGIYKDKPAIIDFKNTIKPKKLEWVQDYFMQVSLYALAHDSMFNTNIKQGVIFMVSRDCTFQKFIIEGVDLDHYKLEACKRVDQYYTI